MSINKNPAIAFIGVGFMGHGIVKNILHGGYALSILDHPGNRPVDDLVSAGARLGQSAEGLAAAADVVFICVTGTPEVEDIMLPKGGVLGGLREGSIVVDCSTALPQSTIKLAATVAEKGGSLIDAPMTRTPKEAEEGRLNVMLGGEGAVIEAVIPIINCYAENIYRTGAVGSGHKMKLLHNYLALGNAVLAAEATACAEICGVDMDTYCEVIMSGGGDSLVFRRLLPYIQNGDDGSFKFSVANAEKDLRYYASMADGLGAAKAGSEAVHELLEQARAAGLEGQSMPKLIDYFRGLGQS